MKCYVTELESHQVLGRYPVPPMDVFTAMLTDDHRATLVTRPAHDVREEITITDDATLLDARLEFDPAPPAPAPPAHDET